MNELAGKHSDHGQKRAIKMGIIVFIAALLILTLYSNTILTMNLPSVWAQEGRSAPLVQQYNGSGLLKPISEVKLTNSAGWNVKDVYVKAGDRVKKGQTLIIYDSRAAERTIQNEKAALERQQLTIQGLQEQHMLARQNGEEVTIRNTKREIAIAQLDMTVQEQKITDLQEDLSNYKGIVAPFDGIIAELNAIEGLPSGSEGSDVVLTNSSSGFHFSVLVPSSIADQLELGSKLEVNVKVKRAIRKMEGTIIEMDQAITDSVIPSTATENDNDTIKLTSQKRVSITLQSPDIQGGELASVTLNTSTANEEGLLVPIKSIYGKGQNKYIFVIEQKSGPLGNTYHANKVSVEVGEANEEEAIIVKGAYPGQFIIVESSEPIQDNDRVRKR